MKALQIAIAIVVVLAWLAGALVAVLDGVTMLRITTPVLLMVCGWIFTAKATTL